MSILFRRLGALSLAFLMVACASRDTSRQLGYDETLAKRFFSVGYQDISNIYIEDVALSELAAAGLGSLSSIDPALEFGRSQSTITLSVNGLEIENFDNPDAGDTDGWASVTAAAIATGRTHSAELRDVDSEQVYETVFDGLLGELDSFSRYAGRETARENRASRDGFGGIGVRIRLVEEGILVLSVMEGTPAEQSGFQKNDIITHIDGEAVEGLSQRDAINRLRGKIRSKVRLTVDRDSTPEVKHIDVVRAHIIPQTITLNREGGVAHLRVTGFNQNTTRSLRKKIVEAKADLGETLRGYIVDLRDNPGGLLDQAVSVSDLFVDSGRLISTRGRHPDSHQYFDADSEDLAASLPIVLLVNGNSASASEIVAAALQDSGRAVVVGSASFGKGTVQTLLRLPNQGELTLTWARFHAPSGYALNRRGILPDICTSGESVDADLVMQRLRSGMLPIDPNIRSQSVDGSSDEEIESFRNLCPPREVEAEIDMEVAKRLISDPALYARALGEAPNTAGLQALLAAE